MSISLNDVASRIISTLRVTDPDLDTSVGTTTRKIIDAVAEQISEAYLDQRMAYYQYDIDSKVDADLDDFVQLFGMARLAARRASGVVIFSRTANLTRAIAIPAQTTIVSNTSPPISVQTVLSAFMEPGEYSAAIPVQAVDSGNEGNLPSGTLVTLSANIEGITSITNPGPLSGGTDQETDAELRDRWKRTVFRSLAGTEQMYLGVALDDTDCYVATVIGASKRRREQVQIVTGVGATTVDDASSVYATPVFVGLNIDGGDLFVPGSDYDWNYTVNPPQIEVVNAARIPDGTLVEVDFEYQPTSSRNDVDNGITNRVDIWVGGQRALNATQTVIYRQAVRFTNTTTDRLYRQRFRRSSDVAPSNDNVFVPLAYGPILTIPSTITIGGTVYGLADSTHAMGTTAVIDSTTINYAYQVVHEDAPFGMTPTSLFGLEWYSGVGFMPPDDSVFTLGGQEEGDYTFNSMILDIQLAVDRWRLLGVDAKVHQAKQKALRLSLAIVYDRNANVDVVNTQIDEQVAALMTTIGFQGRVQISDLLQTIHNVPGVDNVRFLHGSDHSGYNSATPNLYDVGVQWVVDDAVVESYVDLTGRPYDLRFGDAELPVLHSVVKVVKAENSFGAM